MQAQLPSSSLSRSRVNTGCWRFVGRKHQLRHRRPAVPAVASVEELVGEASTSSSRSEDEMQNAAVQHGKRIAVLKARKFAAVPVQDAGRPLAEYMTLPASQYSVLDAKRIERLDDETFVCYVGGLKFFNFEVEPVITVSVTVQERGPTVRLLSTKLRGSKSVEEANSKFKATMTNVVRWREAHSGTQADSSTTGGTTSDSGSSSSSNSVGCSREICSDTSIQVVLEVPRWFIVPVGAIEKTGCAVMETVLRTAVPRFLQQLATDYRLWAQGDDDSRRSAAEESDALAGVQGVQVEQ